MRDQRRDHTAVDTHRTGEAWRSGEDPDLLALELARVLRETLDRCDPDSAVVLGQAITARLFSVGLDLHFVHGLTAHPAARARLEGAIQQLDDVIKDVRRLALRITESSETT